MHQIAQSLSIEQKKKNPNYLTIGGSLVSPSFQFFIFFVFEVPIVKSNCTKICIFSIACIDIRLDCLFRCIYQGQDEASLKCTGYCLYKQLLICSRSSSFYRSSHFFDLLSIVISFIALISGCSKALICKGCPPFVYLLLL